MSQRYRTNAFFNGVSNFRAAFPSLADATIEWREKRGPEDERGLDLRKTGFKRGNFSQGVLPCSNPQCHEGGYAADRLIDAMLRDGETEREGMMLCSGREMAEEVRRGPVRCPYRIEYRATVVPRGEEPPAPPRRSNNRRGRRPRRSTAA